MDEQEKRGRIRRYFSPPNIFFPLGALVLGILLLRAEAPGFGVAAIFSGLILFAAIFSRAKVTDQEIDSWFQEDLKALQERALKRIGLERTDLENDPVMIIGPILWQRSGIPDFDLLWKRGEDNNARFAIYRVTIIFLGEHFLNSYVCDFNFLRNVALNEVNSQYQYKNVVGVSIGEVEDSESHALRTGEKLICKQSFSLSFTNGHQISVMVSAKELKDLTKAELPTTGVERAVSTIRAMLQSKA